MREIFTVVVFLWLISPLILIPVSIHYIKKSKRLEEEVVRRIHSANRINSSPIHLTPPEGTENPGVAPTAPLAPPVPLTPPADVSAAASGTAAPTASIPPAGSSRVYPQPAAATSSVKSVSDKSIGIVMIFGVIFVVLAGLVFASTTWADMNNIVRMVTIFSFSIIFFILSSVAERSLKLERTGTAFYSLGSCFLPITLFAAGYFKVFGEWLSLFGDGKYFLIASAFLIMALVFAKGSADYSSAVFSWSTLFSISFAILSLLRQIFAEIGIFFTAAAVYSLMVIIFSGRVSALSSKKLFGILSRMPVFAALNASLVGVLALMLLRNSPISFSALLIFAACFLFPVFYRRNAYFSAIPFIVFTAAAFVRLTAPADLYEAALPLSCVLLLAAVLSAVKALDRKLCAALFKASLAPAVSVLWICILAVPDRAEMTSILLFAAILSVAGLLIFTLSRDNGTAKTLFSLSLVGVALICTRILFPAGIISALGFSGFVLFLLIAFIIFDRIKLRSIATDSVFVLSLLISGIYTLISLNDFDGKFAAAVPLTLLISAAGALICARRYPSVFSWAAIAAGTGVVLPLNVVLQHYISPEYAKWLFFAAWLLWISVLLAFAVLLSVKKPSSKWRLSLGVFTPCIASLAYLKLFNDYPAYAIMLFLCIYFAVRMIKGEGKGRVRYMICAYLFSISFVWSVSHYHRLSSADIAFQYTIITGFMSVLYYLVSELFLRYAPKSKLAAGLSGISSKCLAIFTAFAMLWYSMFSGYFLPLSILFTASLIICILKRTEAVLVPSLILFFPSAMKFSIEFIGESIAYPVIAGLVVLYMIIGRLLHPRRIAGRGYPDIYALFSLTGIFMLLGGTEKWVWAFLPFTALWLMQFTGRTSYGKGALTLSAAFLVFSWWMQPFINIPDILSLELNLAPLMLFCGALVLIWKKNIRFISNLSFATALFILVVLSLAAMTNNLLIDSIIVAGCAIAILLMSFFIRSRRWIILGITVLSVITLSMARAFWSMFGWWSYLMLAGIILISAGAWNELRKKRAEKSRVISDSSDSFKSES